MEQDDYDKIFKGLAIPQQEVARAYMENNKHIRKTMEIVLDRRLDDEEKDRLKLHSKDLEESERDE